MKRIYRDPSHKMLAGICSGIGELLDVDPTLIRLGLVFATIVTGFVPGIAVYAVGWFIIPLKEDIGRATEQKK